MQIPLSTANILQTEFLELILEEKWCSLLLQGNLYELEQHFHERIISLYERSMEAFIVYISRSYEFKFSQKLIAREKGLKKLSIRWTSIQLRTGVKIRYESFYAKVVPKGYTSSRHMSEFIWQSGESSGLMYKSLSCLYSVLCPSFELAQDMLNYQGIKANFDRVRHLSLSLADTAMTNRSTIQLCEGETVRGKQVVIALDGGRSRTRVYKEGEIGRDKPFTTPWREPKMFVITTIDERGKMNKTFKPIYDATFGDDEVFNLLAQYLKNLEIDKALTVQFLADGTAWIWNRVRQMLVNLGVKEDKIIETLDYYHAAEHLNALKAYFDKNKQGLFPKLKDALWHGDFQQMTQIIKQGIQGVKIEDFNPLKYFEKQQNRINYQTLKDQNRPCGSGIIESGIRRIINLRFKSPSSFWYPDNVEKLIFMRSVALSGRWETMMKNLSG